MVTRFWPYAWKNTSTLPTLKIDLSDHLFIKYDIFEVDVNLPPRLTSIGIVTQYCKHHNVSYIPQSTNNIPWNHAFPARNKTHFFMIRIGRKEPTTVQKVLESILSQKITGKYNIVNVITARRDKDIFRTNIQENICILNQIIQIQALGTN